MVCASMSCYRERSLGTFLVRLLRYHSIGSDFLAGRLLIFDGLSFKTISIYIYIYFYHLRMNHDESVACAILSKSGLKRGSAA